MSPPQFISLYLYFQGLDPIAAAAAYTLLVAAALEQRVAYFPYLALLPAYPPAPARSNRRTRR